MRRFERTGKTGWLALALVALTILVSVLPAASVTQAQEVRYERRSILDFFLGRRYIEEGQDTPDVVRPRRQPQPQQRRRPSPQKAVVTPRVYPDEEPVQKLENAQKILIVGDFLAGGLGDGMASAFETSPGVVIETRSNVSSGLVRDDYYNWPDQLPKMIDEVKPAMVVIMIGANDRQQMAIGANKEKFRTDTWFAEYQRRVLNFGKEVRSHNIPLLWVGLPPFESDSMTADALQMNQIYRAQAESIGGEFVDIWDGFVDENSQFIVTGSDINGQQVRLRTSDGINFTQAGRRKIAFYVEKPARRLLGTQASPDLARLDTGNMPAVSVPTNPVEHTQPISISDPALDGGSELLGGPGLPAAPLSQSPRDLLVERGEMAPAPSGRVDDYRVPEPKAATQSLVK